jgi:hypothetical protein
MIKLLLSINRRGALLPLVAGAEAGGGEEGGRDLGGVLEFARGSEGRNS